MLVLTRKVGDVIAIGDNIKIVVMAIKGKQVRLGVQADRNTIVHREEIYQKIQQETRAALQNDTSSAKAAGDLLRGAAGDAREEDRGESAPRTRRATPGFVVRKATSGEGGANSTHALHGGEEPRARDAGAPPSKRGSGD